MLGKTKCTEVQIAVNFKSYSLIVAEEHLCFQSNGRAIEFW